MTRRVVAVLPGTRLTDALRVMDSAGVRHLPVVEGDRCVGRLTEIDMLRQMVTQGLLQPRCTMRLTAGPGETVRIRGRSTARAPGGLSAAPGTDLRVGRGIALIGVAQDRLGVGVAQEASDGLQRDSGVDLPRIRTVSD